MKRNKRHGGHDVFATLELNYIRGNSAPYFSLTGDVYEAGKPRTDRYCVTCGCCHEAIVAAMPDLADMAALHLSDIDGVPMHAEANGWYNLAGICGGLREEYHRGNSGATWRVPEGTITTDADKCAAMLAEHLRIGAEECAALVARVVGPDWSVACLRDIRTAEQWAQAPAALREELPRMRERFRAEVDAMRPRWKAEADAAIAKYGLTVTGDKWQKTA